MTAEQDGQVAARPRRGSVEVKFTRDRSMRTTFSVRMVLLQAGHTTGVSS